jgi:recombination protein RecA
MESLGVDFSKDKFRMSCPKSTEEGFEIARKFIKAPEVGIIIFDSVAAMIPKAELEGDFGDSKMGLQARAMSQAMRMLVGEISRSNCIVFFINQTREKIGVVYGDNTTTTGGNALKFYASQRLKFAKSQSQKDKEGDFVSTTTKITVDKNKVGIPKRIAEINIVYGQGFDIVQEIVDLGVKFEVIEKKGSWFSYGDVKLGQGADSVKSILLDNPELYEELKEKIILRAEEEKKKKIS